MKYIKSFHPFSILEVKKEIYDTLKLVGSKMPIVLQPRSVSDSLVYEPQVQDSEPSQKPLGLFYSYGTTWIDWIKYNEPDWMTEDVYYMDIRGGNIKKIHTIEEMNSFGEEYGEKLRNNIISIDWKRVSEEYDGIEIGEWHEDYFRALNYHKLWYQSWDIGQGCIWGKGVKVNLTKFGG